MMSAAELKTQGNSFYKRKQYNQALECYSQAIQLDPNNAVYFCNRAACYCAIDIDTYFINAIIDSEQAIKLDPNYAKAYARLAFICYRKNGIPKATINYQRAINCLKNNKSCTLLKRCEKQLKLCQSNLQFHSQQGILSLHSHVAKTALEAGKMKEKYRNYFTLTAFGIPEEQIPPYSGDKLTGEKLLSLKDILEEITIHFRLLGESPEIMVNMLDKSLNERFENKENNMNLNMSEIGKCIDDIENKCDDYKEKSKETKDHSFKYEKIEELKQGRKEMEKVLSETDKNELDARSMWGLMVWKYDRAINKYKQGIKNNESDENLKRWDDCDLNEDSDIYGYPDCMAKKLLFEYGMLPWDENYDEKLATIYKW
eukprot:213428_1